MNKMLLVARFEYWRHVSQRGFLFAVLGIPLIFVLIIGGLIFFFSSQEDNPIGVVDEEGVLIDPAVYEPAEEDSAPIIGFAGEADAEAALRGGDVQAYFVIPADFLETGQVTYYHMGESFGEAPGDFMDYLRASLLREVEPAVAQRFSGDTFDIEFVSLGGESGRRDPFAFLLPFVFGLIFVIGIFTTSGYLLQAVVDEKENRTMEILVTSLTPEKLMTGKIIGLVGVGLTQIVIWIAAAVLGYFVARAYFPNFPVIGVPLSTVAITTAWFIPFYLLIACLMTAIGLSVTSTSEGQQASGIISLLCFAPYWFTFIFFQNPNSPLVVFMSLFPFSSFITILMRWQFTDIPIWQLVVSWVLLAGTAALALYLVGRLLRYGMLRYGQRLSLREIAVALRQS